MVSRGIRGMLLGGICFFAVALFPRAWAETALLVWVNDGEHAYSAEDYSKTVEKITKLSPTLELRTLPLRFYEPPSSLDLPSEIVLPTPENIQAALAGSHEPISSLILSTHGSTDSSLNRTELAGLGAFGAEGVLGPLESLLERIGPRLSPRFNVFLDGCSTFKGGEKEVLARTRPLFERLSRYGVTELRVWGARRTLLAMTQQEMSFAQEFKSIQSDLFPFTAASVGAWLWYASALSSSSLLERGPELGIVAGFYLGATSLFTAISRAQARRSMNGWIAAHAADSQTIREMRLYSPEFNRTFLCSDALKPASDGG